jgi:3-oxoadipate enol-lactonase
MTSSSGTRLHYEEAGTGDNVLLLVHGFPLHSGMWRPQLASPPAGWRVIAPDLRGFGRSPAVLGEQLTMDAAAEDLAILLEELGVQRAVVCGLSMGGYIAFAMFRQHPQRVRALVLCDTRAGADSEEVRQGGCSPSPRSRPAAPTPSWKPCCRSCCRRSRASAGRRWWMRSPR